ncbi:pirin family protein [Agaribacterium sp. ZY112]|uniref:pirin family protein n=1 Tax=Agaribacterium sp. ZY112 TaxID=3233574 RepID=UPI00352467A9
MRETKLMHIFTANTATDGDGVHLLRVFGGHRLELFDPFLMLDEFGSKQADDYIGGFPSHPHRGFETITYMLKGKMEHRDHMGNVGLLEDGGVQWMTAGSGVIHSELPKQTKGEMRGFQLWLNLASKDKLQNPSYEDVPANKIPIYELGKAKVKAIAGSLLIEDTLVEGYFNKDTTKPLYLHIELEAGQNLTLAVASELQSFIYNFDGELELNGETLNKQELARFKQAGPIHVKNNNQFSSEFLLIAGKPLQEPIVQHGPFVMNSQSEIKQAIRDYQEGKLVQK